MAWQLAARVEHDMMEPAELRRRLRVEFPVPSARDDVVLGRGLIEPRGRAIKIVLRRR